MTVDYKQFFENCDKLNIRISGGDWYSEWSITIEELYQNFKARMIAELFQPVQHRHPTQSSDQPVMHAPYTVQTVLLSQPTPPKDV